MNPEPSEVPESTRCGFVGLIGRPNVGKSTLLNQLIGQKLSIATPKPQTTRNRLIGIHTQGAHQVIYVDTPGIHEGKRALNQRMNHYALSSLKENDLNLWLIEPLASGKQTPSRADLQLLERLRPYLPKSALVINKIDRSRPEDILRTIDCFKQEPFLEVLPLSALKGENLEPLQQMVSRNLPESPFYFESDQVTDASERFLAAEFVREALFHQLEQELPYSIAVQVEQFQETPQRVEISCLICVERDSQKGIVIGHKGAMLKKIGTEARLKIEHLLGVPVFLALHVKVLKQWTNNAHYLKDLGYE